jgi:hypothetical protein
MPYLTYSTHCQEWDKLDENNAFRKAAKDYQDLTNTYSGQGTHQHGSPTLDEWYYNFAKDNKEATRDRNDRNNNQVVSKYRKEGPKKAKQGGNKSKNSEPYQCTVVRVNQLWIWTISESQSLLYPIYSVLS